MSNSVRFLSAFKKIESFLKTFTREPDAPFCRLVSKSSESNPTVRYYKVDLKKFADLRNCIAHEEENGQIIAEPNDLAVIRIERIRDTLLDPPKVIPEFQKKVSCLDSKDSIAKAVRTIFDSSFSQIPIYCNGEFMSLLTSNTVARWLGKNVTEDLFSLRETFIDEVLRYVEEEEDSYKFVSRQKTFFDMLEIFGETAKEGKRLEAVLITEKGNPTEKLLGLITVWDLPIIYQKVKI